MGQDTPSTTSVLNNIRVDYGTVGPSLSQRHLFDDTYFQIALDALQRVHKVKVLGGVRRHPYPLSTPRSQSAGRWIKPDELIAICVRFAISWQKNSPIKSGVPHQKGY